MSLVRNLGRLANGEVWQMARDAADHRLLFEGDRVRELRGYGDGFTAILSDGGMFPEVALTGATKYTPGVFHYCALVSGGSVKCWNDVAGFNLRGELGDGTTTRSTDPVDVVGLTGVTELALGNGRSCAAKSDKTVWCWGDEPGDGTGNSPVPVQVTGVTDVVDMGGSYDGLCAIGDGGVYCWGSESDLPIAPSGANPAVPRLMPSLSGAVEIRGGRDHACARFSNGTVKCWGMHGITYNYELGVEAPQATYEPVQVPGINDARQLTVAQSSSCVLRQTGRVTCWGSGFSQPGAILVDLAPIP